MFSDEDLEKPARFDMERFKPVKVEYPSLSSFEETVFQQLKEHYRLVGKLVAHGGTYILPHLSLMVLSLGRSILIEVHFGL